MWICPGSVWCSDPNRSFSPAVWYGCVRLGSGCAPPASTLFLFDTLSPHPRSWRLPFAREAHPLRNDIRTDEGAM